MRSPGVWFAVLVVVGCLVAPYVLGVRPTTTRQRVYVVITIGFLGAAFYATYRKQPTEECAPGSVCETRGVDRVNRFNRVMIWIATLVAVVALTFPTWSGWILG